MRASPSDFHSIFINNVKLNGNSKQFAQQGPMIETISLHDRPQRYRHGRGL
jgi:hypothetical protein